MALRFGHCEAQLPGIFKHPDQNLQAQQIRMLRRYHFKYRLQSGARKEKTYYGLGFSLLVSFLFVLLKENVEEGRKGVTEFQTAITT